MRLTWIGMLLLITGIAQAQVKTIQGLVLDETDQPLTGATVYTSDKKSSAITDLDGLFKLTNVNVGDTLVVHSELRHKQNLWQRDIDCGLSSV